MITRSTHSLRASILAFLFCWLLPHATLAGLPGASYPPVNPGGTASFTPPITPPVSGTPGANKYLQTDGAGVVGWAAKPAAGAVIPPGTGSVFQGPAGTFTSRSLLASDLPLSITLLGAATVRAGVLRAK